jgi:hypothetical protein
MFKKKIITREDGTPYLIRRYLIKTKLFQVCIHKILQSDADCLHDHPWNFISIILKGGYWEGTTPEQVLKGPELYWFKHRNKDSIYYRWFSAGCILFRPAEWKHRLKLEKYLPEYPTIEDAISSLSSQVVIPATTLVIMFRKKREWGFFTKTGWIPWFKYKSTQSCE